MSWMFNEIVQKKVQSIRQATDIFTPLTLDQVCPQTAHRVFLFFHILVLLQHFVWFLVPAALDPRVRKSSEKSQLVFRRRESNPGRRHSKRGAHPSPLCVLGWQAKDVNPWPSIRNWNPPAQTWKLSLLSKFYNLYYTWTQEPSKNVELVMILQQIKIKYKG